MIRVTRILLPTDFSELSSHATRYACALADQFGAELHVLHVYERMLIPESSVGVDWALVLAEAKQSAEKQMTNVLDATWGDGHAVVKAFIEGAPFVEIVRYAREHDIDLIVLGTHGRTGLAHMLLGSVAEKVVRKASCPVLTVRPKGHQFVMP